MRTKLFIAASCMLFAFSACKKTNEVTGGGIGGNGVINIVPQHNGIDIDNGTMVYIKYGAKEAPSYNAYDDSAAAVAVGTGRPMASFKGLTVGKYFIYTKGYDTKYLEHVEGSVVIDVFPEKTYDVNLAVHAVSK